MIGTICPGTFPMPVECILPFTQGVFLVFSGLSVLFFLTLTGVAVFAAVEKDAKKERVDIETLTNLALRTYNLGKLSAFSSAMKEFDELKQKKGRDRDGKRNHRQKRKSAAA